MLLAIDPGNVESAYVAVDDNLKPAYFGKVNNNNLLTMIHDKRFNICQKAAIEMIASYGMAVGKEVFETCLWIGQFKAALEIYAGLEASFIYRKDEKMHICGSMKAKDSNIQRALIDLFAKHDLKRGKGTKKNPDFFYGFHDDIWQAFAVAYTYNEMAKGCE